MIKNDNDELFSKKKINVVDNCDYLSKMNAMQLIKLILDGKLGNIYDDKNKYEEEIKEYELNKYKNSIDNEEFDYYLDNNSYCESAEYEKIYESNKKYYELYNNVFTTINNSDYSDNEINLIIDEINKCNSYYLLGQFINVISNNSFLLRKLFDRNDKLQEASRVYMIKKLNSYY